MPTNPYPYPGVITSDDIRRLPVAVPDRVATARRLLACGTVTLAAVARAWWAGDTEAAKRAIYPPTAAPRRRRAA
jgi:hypothetical protein